MSWRDRATAAPSAPQEQPSTAGGWKSRATPAEPSQEPQPSGDYWGDVRKNATEGLKQSGDTVLGLVKAGTDVLGMSSPVELAKSAYQVGTGTPFSKTPTAEHFRGTRDFIKGSAEGIWQGAKDAAKIPYAGYEMSQGTPIGQTKMGQTFRERPISMPLGVASTILPLRGAGKLAKSTFAGENPNFLERMGGRGMNDSLGIKGGTVDEMTPQKDNPGRTGIRLGMQLAEEGTKGMGSIEGLDQINKNLSKHGKSVQSALNAIKETNKSYGVYPELGDPLKVKANPILKPFLDRANEMESSDYPLQQFESKYHRAVYNALSKAAKEGGDFLSLDDVRNEMSKVGDMLNSAGEDHAGVIRKIYGKLANLQDGMVETIADQAGDPKLASNLKEANANYSRYIRILPDVRKSASNASVKAGELKGHPIASAFKALEPKVAGLAYSAGKFARGASEVAGEATAIPGKAASSIFNKGKQMARDERGSIFPESNQGKSSQEPGDITRLGPARPGSLPEVKPGSKSGQPHALLSYEDNYGPNGTKRKIYTVYGDPSHPVFKKMGWGSSVPESELNGIKITGKEPPRGARKPFK